MTDVWFVGRHVSPRLTWDDSPALPEHLVLRDVAMRAEPLHGRDGRPWGQLLSTGGLTAARVGQVEAGGVTVSGCLSYDGYFQSSRQVPTTPCVVRGIRVVSDLHDRGPDRWIRRPGATRLIDVPTTSGEHLSDDPPLMDAAPDGWTAEPDAAMWLSQEQYLREYGHLFPAEQWQARGFLVALQPV